MPAIGQYTQIFSDYVQVVEVAPPVAPYVLTPSLFDGYAPAPPDTRLALPGSVGVNATTPDSAAFPVADIEIMVCLSMADWDPTANADQDLVSQYDTVGNQRAFRFYRKQGGFLGYTQSPDGIASDNAVTTIRPPVTDGAAIWLRTKRTDLDGTSDFSYAPYQVGEPATWTTLQNNRAGTAGTMFAATAPIEVGSAALGQTNNLNGNVYRVIIKAAGVKVLDFDPRDWQGGTSWVSTATGEAWTLNGGAQVVPLYQATGAYWGVKGA